MKSFKNFVSIVAALSCIVLLGATASFAAEIDHARFMAEFARFVQHEVNSEKEIREKLDVFIVENKKALGDGFGIHPELMAKVYELAGTEKLSCLSGRYFTVFQKDLTNEEREAFYATKRNMDRWVYVLAVEEAARLGVIKPSPPLTYRFREDFPANISAAMKAAMSPYLNVKQDKAGGGGAGFDDIVCD